MSQNLSLSSVVNPTDLTRFDAMYETRQAEIQDRIEEARAGEIDISAAQIRFLVDNVQAKFSNRYGLPAEGTEAKYYNSNRDLDPNPSSISNIPDKLITLAERICGGANAIMNTSLIAFPENMFPGYAQKYYGLDMLRKGNDGRSNPIHKYNSHVAMISSHTQMRSVIPHFDKTLTEILVSNNTPNTTDSVYATDPLIDGFTPPIRVTVYNNPDALDQLDEDRSKTLRPNGYCRISYAPDTQNERRLKPVKKITQHVDEKILILDDENLTQGRFVRDSDVDYRTQVEHYRELYIYKRDGQVTNTTPHAVTSLVPIDTQSREVRGNTEWTYDKRTGDITLKIGFCIPGNNLIERRIQTPNGTVSVLCEASVYGMEQIAFLKDHPVYGEVLSESFVKSPKYTDVELYQLLHDFFTGSVSQLEEDWDKQE